MELVIKLLGKTSKQSVTDFIAKMLSEDAPLFKDEVDAEDEIFMTVTYFPRAAWRCK